MNKGQLFVLSGPSGSGKDTVLKEILAKMKGEAFLSVSMTTRKMRPGEKEGIDYFYVSREEFQENINKGRMLEFAQYGGNYYGTPAAAVEKLLNEGKTVFLNIEVQGGANVRRLMPEAIQIFILPPSLNELHRRLLKRGTESEEAVNVRMGIAKEEIVHANEYDYVIINDDLDFAVNDVMSIVRACQLALNKENIISEVVNNA